jgi:hypothetical protein
LVQLVAGEVVYVEGVVAPGLVHVPAAHGEQTRSAMAVAEVEKYVP